MRPSLSPDETAPRAGASRPLCPWGTNRRFAPRPEGERGHPCRWPVRARIRPCVGNARRRRGRRARRRGPSPSDRSRIPCRVRGGSGARRRGAPRSRSDFLNFVYGVASKAKNFPQSWDQALSPTAAERLLDNIAKLGQFADYFKDRYFVSCWHMSEYESDAMWKLYGASNNVSPYVPHLLVSRHACQSTRGRGLSAISTTAPKIFQ
jgi:hypothetical protein